MSTLDEPLRGPLPVAAESAPPRESWWDRADRWFAKAGEWLNPILVKESRQALKSKQFLVTFTLVLAFAWIATMMGVAFIGPSIYHGTHGKTMFDIYFPILSFPLLVIVPFSAFRSLAAEREDGTFELLSITTLKPRQVIAGKLNSAVLQMLVYFSAMAPCMAFTYLLQGIDFPSILYLLFYTFMASLGLSVVGLAAATITQEKHWQIVLSVVLIIGLLAAFIFGSIFALVSLEESAIAFREPDFWWINAAFLSAYLSYLALFYFVAAGQITFASENRSTVLRIVMLVQQLLLTGWMVWGFSKWPEDDAILAYVMLALFHWYVMGVFMTSERPELSSRVRRSLPQSFFGRAFFTWFNPGPGAGFVFALTNAFSALVFAGLGTLFFVASFPAKLQNFSVTKADSLTSFGILGFSYMIIYLGLGRLAIALARRVSHVTMLLGVLLQILLLLAGCAVPLTIHLMTPDLRNDYSLLEITNPLWTLAEVGQGGLGSELTVLLIAVPIAAFVVLLLNLPGVVREVRYVRIAKPVRVSEEDAALEAAIHPPQPVKLSPWD